MKILFVCTAGEQRSPTAAELVHARYPWHEAKFAGLHPLSDVPITKEAVEWADIIFAMETMHKSLLLEKLPMELKEKDIIVLGLPDIYAGNDAKLIGDLEKELKKYLSQY